MKKGQELSMTVIVIAAIALIVLVILAAIFIGRAGKTAVGVDSCKGRCVASSDECAGQYERVTNDPCYDSSSKKTDQLCCLGVDVGNNGN
ncbi:hypothetical protein HZB02_06370 [Candidatus Woesearchaeota archaeon]|nr:hypothetical protein [Candidatus Woesearchaeota archaeon]